MKVMKRFNKQTSDPVNKPAQSCHMHQFLMSQLFKYLEHLPNTICYYICKICALVSPRNIFHLRDLCQDVTQEEEEEVTDSSLMPQHMKKTGRMQS